MKKKTTKKKASIKLTTAATPVRKEDVIEKEGVGLDLDFNAANLAGKVAERICTVLIVCGVMLVSAAFALYWAVTGKPFTIVTYKK